jgi:hypothetical protein
VPREVKENENRVAMTPAGVEELVALLAAEHGFRGDVPAGAKIDDTVDERTGVPVFSLPISKPSFSSEAEIPIEARSPDRPPPYWLSPIWIIPFKKVPLVNTTDLLSNVWPVWVTTPLTLFPSSSVRISTTLSWRK